MTTYAFIGDLHNKETTYLPHVESLLDEGFVDRVVLLGDYLNDWASSPENEIQEVQALHDFVLSHTREEVVLLAGNHDLPYIMHPGDKGFKPICYHSPGFQWDAWDDVHQLYQDLPFVPIHHMLSGGHDWLVSHAGATTGWVHMNGVPTEPGPLSEALMDLWSARSFIPFTEVGHGRGGNSLYPSPLWADRSELEYDALKSVNQVVGHTPVPTVSTVTTRYHELVFCDTMSTYTDGRPIGDATIAVMDDATGMVTVRPLLGDE
jgi:hypothetical protein